MFAMLPYDPSPDQSRYERIEAYLAGRLSPEERVEFELAMASEPAFKEEVALHRSMGEALHDPEETAFRNSLSEIDRALRKEQGTSPSGEDNPATRMRRIVAVRRWSAAVAAMLVLAVGVTWLWPDAGAGKSGPALAETMVQKHIGSYQAPAATRGPAEDARKRMQAGFAAFDRQAYAEALTDFAALPPALQTHPDVLFFQGLSLLHVHQGSEAANRFDALLRQGDTQWTADAEWHLVLALVQAGRYRDAQARCAGLVEQQGPFAGPAKKLLPDLERLMATELPEGAVP